MHKHIPIAFVLSLFLLAALGTSDTSAQEKNKPIKGANVLELFHGTWDVKTTVEPTNGKKRTKMVVSKRFKSLGGKFLRFEDENNHDPNEPEFHMLLTYDPKQKNYPGVYMAGSERAKITGTWDETTNTMTFKVNVPEKFQFVGVHRFIGNNRAEASATVTDPNGKVLTKFTWKETKRKEKE